MLRPSVRPACFFSSGYSPPQRLAFTSSTRWLRLAGSNWPLADQPWVTLRRRSATKELVQVREQKLLAAGCPAPWATVWLAVL